MPAYFRLGALARSIPALPQDSACKDHPCAKVEHFMVSYVLVEAKPPIIQPDIVPQRMLPHEEPE
jgi:hypothetical protein